MTILAVVDAVLLRPLPFPQPDRLLTMFNTYPKAGIERNGASLVNYYERRRTLAAFSHVAILSQGTAIVGDAGSTDQVDLMRVSPEYFAMLGVDSIMGRALTDEEMTYQTDGVAILTDTCWRHRFNADPHILGRLAQSIDHRIAVRDARWNRKPRRPASAPWIHRGPDCVGLRAELAVVP